MVHTYIKTPTKANISEERIQLSFQSKCNSQQIFTKEEESKSGVSTVLAVPKIVVPKGCKQVGQTVSGERGEQVTFVTASGETFPPVYVFSRTCCIEVRRQPLEEPGNWKIQRPQEPQEPVPGSCNVTDMLKKDDGGIARSQYSVQEEPNKIKNYFETTDLLSTSSLAIQITPEMIRPFLKAQNVKIRVSRKKKISRILTESSEKNAMEKEYEEKRREIATINIKKNQPGESDVDFAVEDEDSEIKLGDFVLVKFATKKNIKHFVGRVEKILSADEYCVFFLKKE
ncbi:hypothetical protein ILUMI_01579 [Ignelater luminosus]|uniref:Uncharacterized protein n=1 Tax=Ignelater luminosus TaxID=2038154 RepID=A0A8K0DEB2_IGNLU|nr:hypothetical protein ILUMI_01579 [Ignelater luminosus]